MARGQRGWGQRRDTSWSLPAHTQVTPEGPVTEGSQQPQSKKALDHPVGLRHPQTQTPSSHSAACLPSGGWGVSHLDWSGGPWT